MKRLPLTRGRVALIDDSDLTHLSRWNWSAHRCGDKWYAARGTWRGETIFMHREILALRPGDGRIVDHINANGLDNRRANLRVVSHAQNCQNQTPRSGTLSRYKGVTWDRSRGKWLAAIKQDGRRYFLGRFGDEVDAALAYDLAAADRFGVFARLNFLERWAA